MHHAVQGEKSPPSLGQGAGMPRCACPQPWPPGWTPLHGEGGVVPRSPRTAVRSDQLILEAARKTVIGNIWQAMRWVTSASLASGWPWTAEHAALQQRTMAMLSTRGAQLIQTLLHSNRLCGRPVKPPKLSFHKYHILFLLG